MIHVISNPDFCQARFSVPFFPFDIPLTCGMAYGEKLATRIRERLEGLKKVEEKQMMGGLTFMYKGKMCVGIFRNRLLCRIDPAINDLLLEKEGCHQMSFGGKSMKGWILIDETGMKTKKHFNYWVDLALEYNSQIKSNKKKK